MIRAKFVVQQISRNTYGHSVRLTPVTTGTEEDRSFFKATPAGQIELGGLQEEVVRLFGDPGDPFYVDFTSAKAPAEAAQG